MANKFTRHAKAAFVQNFAVLHNHRIAERPAKGEARILHRFDITHLAEGACRGEIADEAAIAVEIVEALATDGRILEINLGLDFKAVCRLDPRPSASMLDADRSRDDQCTTAHRKCGDARAQDRLDDRQAAAIQNGSLAGVDLDDGVVDAETGKGGHDMLDSLEAHAVLVGDPRAQPRLLDVVGMRVDGLTAFGDVDAAELDAGVRSCRVNLDPDETAGVQPYAIEGDDIAYCGLHRLFTVHRRDGPGWYFYLSAVGSAVMAGCCAKDHA